MSAIAPDTLSKDFHRLRPGIPPLENGDHLTRAEFERRYTNMPALKKAELIKGVVLMGSPVRFAQHGRPHANAAGWLTYYAGRTPGLEVGDNATVRLADDSEPQPDLLLRIPEQLGGLSRLDPDGYLTGPVELIVEIAASSVAIDAHDKRDAYAAAGVREYVLWRVDDSAIDWFILRNGEFEDLPRSVDGLFRSATFPGLWLDPPLLLRGDLVATLAVVDAGIASPEHADFLKNLAARHQAL